MPESDKKLREDVRILLVEDDEDDYVILDELLREIKRDDLRIEWVQSVEDARKAVRREEHDVVLVDYRLGAETGLDLLRELEELGFKGPTVLLTGQADPEIDMAAMKGGAADYLVKGTFDAQTLDRVIRYALSQYRLHDATLARAQAEAESRAKDEFISIVSHELRTPLQVMTIVAEILQAEELSEGGQRAVNRLADNCHRMTLVVSDLLDATRIERGELKLQKAPLDFVALVARAVRDIADSEKSGPHPTFEAEVDEAIVLGDRERLGQVVDNLLNNAVKFTPPGGWIKVTVKKQGTDAILEVEDSGAGIEPDELQRVFQRFRRAKNNRRGDGLGLGLAIVRHIVKSHDGSVSAQSEGRGRGATFTVRLPLTAER